MKPPQEAAGIHPRQSVTLTIAMHTVSEANVREHWKKRHHRAKQQRSAMYYRCRATWPTVPPLPLTVTLTRVSPRALDSHDNLRSSMKACVDAIADWLAGAYGTGNDRQDGIEWRYAQRKGMPNAYAVEVAITQAEEE